MSGLSQYQNVFRVAKTDATKNVTQPRAMKRSRDPVSCVACRTRKLKCDRQVPCMPCAKRGDVASCNYSNYNNILRKGPRTSKAQLRLQKLEEIVASLMQNSVKTSENHIEHTSPYAAVDQHLKELSFQNSTPTSETPPIGRLDIQDSEANYTGATHWATILENIRDIQDFLEPETDGDGEDLHSAHLDLLIGSVPSLTLADACNSLPPRPVADKLLEIYFSPEYLQNPVIHVGKFMKEYKNFWIDPSSVSFLWISILFSALWIGSQISRSSSEEVFKQQEDSVRSVFLIKAGQALVTGGYHKARPYSVEALIIYALCKYMRRDDSDADAWMIMGMCTRLAMKMGYHRDPRHFANISFFEGEMRRRTFYVIEVFDLLLSFQTGVPAIIHEEECDTEPPRNLFDEDFDEDCNVLPPSRPLTDSTPMVYFYYKSRYVKIFKRIVRHALSLKTPSYEDTMGLDRELNEMHADIPPSIRIGPSGSILSDPGSMVLSRLYINLLYQQSLCVLHRPYISLSRSNAAFAYSRKRCTDAALQTLKYQAELHVASQPGGEFHKDRYMLSSMVFHAFLMAAMIICFDLYESCHKPDAMFQEYSMSQMSKYDALRFSYEIWMLRRGDSRDARHASNVLAAMLSKVPKPNATVAPLAPQSISGTLQNPTTEEGLVGSGINSSKASWTVNPYNDPSEDFPTDFYSSLNLDASDPLNTILNESDQIDWGLIDQYLFDGNDVGDT